MKNEISPGDFVLGFVCICTERFNECSAVYGKANGTFKEGGHRHAYHVVIDTAITDSLNGWRK